MKGSNKEIMWRIYLIYLGFSIILIVVLVKTFVLQFDGMTNVFVARSEDNQKMPTRSVERIPRRGEILDVSYVPLVTSVSFYDIHMDPTVVSQEIFDAEIHELAIQLSSLYPSKTRGDWERYIRQARAQKRRYLLIKKQATIEEKKTLASFPIFKLGRLKGGFIDSDETIVRKRPHGELLRRTLGYYRPKDGKSSALKIGIEGAFNDFLAGEAGEEIEQKYGNGWKKTGQILREAVEGASVVTSIDLEIQEVAHSELQRQLQQQSAKNGVVIVMEVKTGFIKAISSLTKGADGNYYETYNHAIGSKEVPGSTFKLASLMALLEDKKVSVYDKVDANGVYKFYDSEMKDHGPGYGKITIQEAFEKSSNVFSKIVNDAYKSNPSGFISRLRSFGIGDTLGLPIKGEVAPTLYYPGHANWSGISLPWMAVGYEVQMTALQTLAFYNAVANNGRFMKPQFVKEVIRGQEVVKTFEPIVMREKICSDATVRTLQKCLAGVVQNGTGRALKSAYLEIAGKTGTARILNDDNTYGEKGSYKYQASFAGYFPADEPIYSAIVLVSAPTSEIYGARVSGTVFSAIANKVYASTLKYHQAINEAEALKNEMPVSKSGSRTDLEKMFRYMRIPFSSGIEGDWVTTAKKETFVEFQERFVGIDTVPNVTGMSAKDAVYLIERTGMKVRIDGMGTVTHQSVAPGAKVYNGTVELILK